jgi:Domain of unknown function (DUF4404)
MESPIRQRLEDLATTLHLRREEAPSADSARDAVQQALKEDSFDGLGDRLERFAIELETDHPTLGALIRSVVDELSALGI